MVQFILSLLVYAGLAQGIFAVDSSNVLQNLTETISARSGKVNRGVDFSDEISSSDADCFATEVEFVIPRGFHSTGVVDTAVCTSIINAAAAGIKKRDTYMFPCPTCSSSASSQMSDLVAFLNDNCKAEWSGRIWLDIEGSQYWLGSESQNRAWYEELVDSCKSSRVTCGVYSSASQWNAIFGESYSYGPSTRMPLWYAHYDNLESFDDFDSFGGWTTPHAKQYMGDVTQCYMDVDRNYSPNF